MICCPFGPANPACASLPPRRRANIATILIGCSSICGILNRGSAHGRQSRAKNFQCTTVVPDLTDQRIHAARATRLLVLP
jgi:hypothetical protein